MAAVWQCIKGYLFSSIYDDVHSWGSHATDITVDKSTEDATQHNIDTIPLLDDTHSSVVVGRNVALA